VAQHDPDARVDTSVRALEGQDGFGIYADGMQELDWVVGALLGELDQLGIAEDTIVIFTTERCGEVQ
jgi:arylsulfatase